MLEIVAIQNWFIPTFRSTHYAPHGILLVRDSETKKTKSCRTKGCEMGDSADYLYITFNRKRYKVENMGSVFNPTCDKMKLIEL